MSLVSDVFSEGNACLSKLLYELLGSYNYIKIKEIRQGCPSACNAVADWMICTQIWQITCFSPRSYNAVCAH